MLGAARTAWQAAGVEVVGVALAARAALELRNGAGIPATTIDRLLLQVGRPGGHLPEGGVLVVDEAGMVGTRTRTLARLLGLAEPARCEVVLVGDDHQLPEIDAGGALTGLTRRLPAIELTRNRRQKQQWERDTLDELRYGDIADAVNNYDQQQRLVVAETVDAVRQQLVGDWWQAVAEHGTDALMVAARRIDIDDLNHRPRQRMDAADELGDTAVADPSSAPLPDTLDFRTPWTRGGHARRGRRGMARDAAGRSWSVAAGQRYRRGSGGTHRDGCWAEYYLYVEDAKK